MICSERNWQTTFVCLLVVALSGCTGPGKGPSSAQTKQPPTPSTAPPALPTATPGSTLGSHWPVSFPETFGDQLDAVAADGGLFAASPAQILAFNPAGQLRAGWPVDSPVGGPIRAIAVAPDGTLLVAGGGQIADLEKSGRIADGWPVSLAGRFGGLYVAPDSIIVDEQPAQSGAGRLDGLSLGPGTHLAWTVAVAGGPAEAPAFGPEGTLYLPLSHGDPGTATIVAVSPEGRIPSGYPIPWWSGGLAVAPDGSPVVWSYTTAGSGAIVQVRQTRIARLDPSGDPAPGWPQVIDGPASAPAFAADATMYVVIAPKGHSTGSIAAIGPDGTPRTGWPAPLPTGCQGALRAATATDVPVAQAPVVDPSGLVYVEARCSTDTIVAAFGQSGQPVVGTPYTLSQGASLGEVSDGAPEGRPAGLVLGAAGLVFALVRGPGSNASLVALEGGHLASGWPVTSPAAALPYAVGTPKDGGLVVVYTDLATNRLAATRFLVTGAVAGAGADPAAGGATR